MRNVTLPGGETVPALGLGTWRMGERTGDRAAEVAALRAGLEHGIRLVDTAEMYGSGGAEEVVAEAIAGRRDEIFLVSKVLPENASRQGTIAACERTLRRLATDRIDLYLLHWRGAHPLADTVAALEALRRAGKVRHWGVSNFDTEDMTELARQPGGEHCAADQVLYHLGERGIERGLLGCLAGHGMAAMAYSPLAQGRILRNRTLREIADRHGVSPAAVAVAWTLRLPGVISIPKTSRADRVADLVRGGDIVLSGDDLKLLDRAFPPPARDTPLAML